jgi:hypothetical protein
MNIEKAKNMLLSLQQNTDEKCEIRIGNRSFENVLQFKYL